MQTKSRFQFSLPPPISATSRGSAKNRARALELCQRNHEAHRLVRCLPRELGRIRARREQSDGAAETTGVCVRPTEAPSVRCWSCAHAVNLRAPYRCRQCRAVTRPTWSEQLLLISGLLWRRAPLLAA
jgi:hypothetical protein